MKLQVVHTSGKSTELEVAKAVFGEKPNTSLLAQALRVYQLNQRQGTAKVKTRSEVARTKKKWYKQKGTGGARHGARTPSIFVGGGVAHGPDGTTDWSLKLTTAQKQRALVSALSSQTKCMVVSDDIEKLSGKTKGAVKLFNTIAPDSKHLLIILHDSLQNVVRSTANLQNVVVTQASRLNIYETLLADKIILTESAVRILELKYSGEKKVEKFIEKPVMNIVVKTPAKTRAKTLAKTAKTRDKISAQTKLKLKTVKPKAVAKPKVVAKRKTIVKPKAKKTVRKK